jgi:hypothetical protein
MNLFIDLIDKGKINSEAELKALFRKLSKKLHPDLSKQNHGSEEFVKLKRDFDQSIPILIKHIIEQTNKDQISQPKKSYHIDDKPISKQILRFNRKEYYSTLMDIVHCNFPVKVTAKTRNPLLNGRLEYFSQLHNLHRPRFKYSIEEFESELYQVRDIGVIENPLFGQILMIFYNVSSFQVLENKFSIRSCNKWLDEIRPELEEKKLNAIHEILDFWVKDMKNGAEFKESAWDPKSYRTV